MASNAPNYSDGNTSSGTGHGHGHGHGHGDIEKGHGTNGAAAHGNDRDGGAALGRQLSVQLTQEQYERLFFQPGAPTRGDYAKRFGNPTLLGIIGFLLCLTPTSMVLMGWRGTDSTSIIPMIGVYYFLGGLCMTLAAIGEFILGNTFPFTVFASFGSFWLSLGTVQDPMHSVVEAFASTGGVASKELNAGLAHYFCIWGVVCLVYFIASMRTNLAFALIFFTLIFAFELLAAGYWTIAYATGPADLAKALKILKAAGAFAFVTCLSGWYLAIVLACAATAVPLALPVGDLSNFMAAKNK